MKNPAMLAISMRVMRAVYPSGNAELRDALAHDWWRFLAAALPGVPVLPVPNCPCAVAVLRALPVCGLILSGGDDWGAFPERDATEEQLFTWARGQGLPLLGVCRGAQVINRLMGGATGTGYAQGHVGTRHAVQLLPHAPGQPCPLAWEVNSWHACGIQVEHLAPGLLPFALAADGSVEGFCSPAGRMLGIMWHPERETAVREYDVRLFQYLFGGQAACRRRQSF